MNILVIGLGNIGKRHLQSLLKRSFSVQIYLYDICKIQFSSKEKKHTIYNLNKLPKNSKFELAIIATTSTKRYQLLKEITHNNNIKKIVIEKIAFLTKKQYLNALNYKNLLINYPRPLMKSYSNLKNYFLKSMTIERISVYGNNWNMLSNTPHFMNLFLYLTEENLSKINSIKIHNRIYRSKRKGFHELKGSLSFRNNQNQYLDLFDSSNYKNSYIQIYTDNLIFRIYESKSVIKIYDKKFNLIKKDKFIIELQSDLTNKFFKSFNNRDFQFLFLNKCIHNELLYINFLNILKKTNSKFYKIMYS